MCVSSSCHYSSSYTSVQRTFAVVAEQVLLGLGLKPPATLSTGAALLGLSPPLASAEGRALAAVADFVYVRCTSLGRADDDV